MRFPRRAGLLLHPTSLPGRFGIGDLGPEAVHFARQLAQMGQRLWQVLPLGPTGFGNSPYQCTSSFAGNPLLISPDWLAEAGLITRHDLESAPSFNDRHVRYGEVINWKRNILLRACAAFHRSPPTAMTRRYRAFRQRERAWLDDYALYAALKEAHDLRPWYAWPHPLRTRAAGALRNARSHHADACEQARIRQFLFHEHWTRVRTACSDRGIQVIGDVPIFVAHDSADLWARPDLFHVDHHGNLRVQAGVPPDYFSADGQLWGNPLYRWDVHAGEGYAWWISRVQKALEQYDVIRVDHFRGMVAHWEVAGRARTAKHGKWMPGPGAELFDALRTACGPLPVIAEDLGVITGEVEALRDRFAFPGMRILQFAFGTDPKADDFLPDRFPRNCVVYTGTHDNDTTVGWFQSTPDAQSTRTANEIIAERRAILAYLGTDGAEIHWDLIDLALQSRADTAMIPVQDLLGLPSSARMNLPGSQGENWTWRFTWQDLTPQVMERLARLTHRANRNRTLTDRHRSR